MPKGSRETEVQNQPRQCGSKGEIPILFSVSNKRFAPDTGGIDIDPACSQSLGLIIIVELAKFRPGKFKCTGSEKPGVYRGNKDEQQQKTWIFDNGSPRSYSQPKSAGTVHPGLAPGRLRLVPLHLLIASPAPDPPIAAHQPRIPVEAVTSRRTPARTRATARWTSSKPTG